MGHRGQGVLATQYGFCREDDIHHQIAPFRHGNVGKRALQEAGKGHGDTARHDWAWVSLFLHWSSINDGVSGRSMGLRRSRRRP